MILRSGFVFGHMVRSDKGVRHNGPELDKTPLLFCAATEEIGGFALLRLGRFYRDSGVMVFSDKENGV